MVIRYNYIVRSRFEGMFQYKNIQHCGTGEMPFPLMPTSGWNGLFDLDLLWLSLSLCSQDQSKVFLAQYLHCLISWSQSQPLRIFEALYRVTHLIAENLPLTQFRQFWQLVGRDCSYLLPRQDDGSFQSQVSGRLSPSRIVTLYVTCVNQFDAGTSPLTTCIASTT